MGRTLRILKRPRTLFGWLPVLATVGVLALHQWNVEESTRIATAAGWTGEAAVASDRVLELTLDLQHSPALEPWLRYEELYSAARTLEIQVAQRVSHVNQALLGSGDKAPALVGVELKVLQGLRAGAMAFAPPSVVGADVLHSRRTDLQSLASLLNSFAKGNASIEYFVLADHDFEKSLASLADAASSYKRAVGKVSYVPSDDHDTGRQVRLSIEGQRAILDQIPPHGSVPLIGNLARKLSTIRDVVQTAAVVKLFAPVTSMRRVN